jgi:SAM-dependent methyltransferase
METSPVRLNLGCGAKIWRGFVNVDLANNWTSIQPDVVADVTGPLPFPDDYADEVHAYHLFEHIHRWKAEDTLREWIRVLKPGGLLILEMPCLDKIIALINHFIESQTPGDPRLTLWGLYGDPGYKNEAMVHKWCYGVAELTHILQRVGMQDIQEQRPKTHQPVRDMRIESKKWQLPTVT